MATLSIDEQIAAFLKLLNEQQKQAVLSVIKTFTEKEQEVTSSTDTSFVAEMDTRYNALTSGAIAGHSWDEVKQMARKAVKDTAR